MTRPVSIRGFTLVEIVIAIGVISVAALALVGLLSVGLDAAREAKEETACGLVARYVYSDLETDAISAEDPSASVVSPFNPASLSSGFSKRYYFTQDGIFLGNALPATPDATRPPFFLADAAIASPPGALAAGVANQGVSPKELRAVALSIKWPVLAGTGTVSATARTSDFSFLIGKVFYRKSVEGDR